MNMRLTRGQRKAILLKARAIELIETNSASELERLDLAYSAGHLYSISNKNAFVLLEKIGPKYVEKTPEHSPHKGSYLWKKFVLPGNEFIRTVFKDKLMIEIQNVAANCIDPKTIEENPVGCFELGVFSFARIIGIDPARVRYLIDYEFQSHRPGFHSLVLEKRRADEFIARYGGLYHFYRVDSFPRLERSRFGGERVVSRGVVSVRYPIPHKREHHSTHRSNVERIRVKLVLPIYPTTRKTERISIGKYDGFVAPTRDSSDYLLWALEVRGFSPGDRPAQLSGDFATMYSSTLVEKESDPNYQFLVGAMLTQSQEEHRAPVLRKFVMFRLCDYAVEAVGNVTNKSNVYRGGYFRLFDKTTNETFEERRVTRVHPGFIVGDSKFVTRDNDETDGLSSSDLEALRILESPATEMFLSPELG